MLLTIPPDLRVALFAAKSFGLRFDPLNLVLYVNRLTNAPTRSGPPKEATWWDSITGLLQRRACDRDLNVLAAPEPTPGSCWCAAP